MKCIVFTRWKRKYENEHYVEERDIAREKCKRHDFNLYSNVKSVCQHDHERETDSLGIHAVQFRYKISTEGEWSIYGDSHPINVRCGCRANSSKRYSHERCENARAPPMKQKKKKKKLRCKLEVYISRTLFFSVYILVYMYTYVANNHGGYYINIKCASHRLSTRK